PASTGAAIPPVGPARAPTTRAVRTPDRGRTTPPGATPSSTTSSTAPSVWEPCPRCPGSTGPRSSRWSSTRRSDSARRVPGRGCHGDARYDQVKLSVQVTDVVARGGDVLVRRVGVRRDPSSPVTRASLVAFENMNLVVSKYAQFPIQDRYSSTWQPGGLPAAHRGGAPATCDG